MKSGKVTWAHWHVFGTVLGHRTEEKDLYLVGQQSWPQVRTAFLGECGVQVGMVQTQDSSVLQLALSFSWNSVA